MDEVEVEVSSSSRYNYHNRVGGESNKSLLLLASSASQVLAGCVWPVRVTFAELVVELALSCTLSLLLNSFSLGETRREMFTFGKRPNVKMAEQKKLEQNWPREA